MAKKNVNQAIESEKDAVLWHDRKRVLGMPLSFTVYEVTDDRFILRKGFLRFCSIVFWILKWYVRWGRRFSA